MHRPFFLLLSRSCWGQWPLIFFWLSFHSHLIKNCYISNCEDIEWQVVKWDYLTPLILIRVTRKIGDNRNKFQTNTLTSCKLCPKSCYFLRLEIISRYHPRLNSINNPVYTSFLRLTFVFCQNCICIFNQALCLNSH